MTAQPERVTRSVASNRHGESALNRLRPLLRYRGYLALATIVVTAAAAVFVLPAFALDLSVFELDGNAVTDHTGTTIPDDWDRVCHQVLGNDCSTANNTAAATSVQGCLSGANCCRRYDTNSAICP